jgi:hypothetical protein
MYDEQPTVIVYFTIKPFHQCEQSLLIPPGKLDVTKNPFAQIIGSLPRKSIAHMCPHNLVFIQDFGDCRMLGVAEGLDELLDRDGLMVGEGIAQGAEAGSVDEDVGVRHDPDDGTGEVRVDLVHLLGGARGLEEHGGDLLLAYEDHAVGRGNDVRSSLA